MTNLNSDLEMDNGVLNSKMKNLQSVKNSRLCKCLKDTFEDYCQHSSLSGIQYIGDRSRPVKERIFWISIFCVSICYCIYSVHSVYSKWQNTPVIVTFGEKSTPVWNIPFPAVTICPETKRRFSEENANTFASLFKQLKSYNAEDTFEPENVTAAEMDEFRALLHVCNTKMLNEDIPLIPGRELDYNKMLDEMLPPLNDNLVFCDWLSNYKNCDSYFRPILTEDGICYTYNGLAPTDIFREDTYQYQYPNLLENDTRTTWSLDKGYDAGVDVETFPGRVLSSGLGSAMQILVNSAIDDIDYGCRGAVQGFKVILHSPEDIPQVSQQFARVPMEQEILIAVKPNMMTTSEGIADYSPARRQCFLNQERFLRFFKTYSQSNCQLECLTNFTLGQCGCVKFSMPRSLDTPVCSEKDIYCYANAEQRLLRDEFKDGNEQTESSNEKESACNCLPACTSLSYSTEISQGRFELYKTLKALGDTEITETFPNSQMSSLWIFFKEGQFITSKRSELYGFMEFLGNCGGIFGLFISFSILSLVEFIYYFTFRFWENLKELPKVIPK